MVILRVQVHSYPAVQWAQLEGCRPVVFDVLRATTTMLAALSAGAREIWPTESLREARDRYRNAPDGCCLGGERQGLLPRGFHLGNSPGEYRPAVVAGKTVILTTTNGTRALLASTCLGAPYIGALVNGACLAAALAEPCLALILAGRKGTLAAEDLLGAGYLLHCLDERGSLQTDDLGRIALGYYRQSATDLLGALRATTAGSRLKELGLGDDIEYAAERDRHPILAVFTAGQVRPVS